MSISSTLNLSLVLSDGTASMTKTVSGLTYTGSNESYTNQLTVGTSSVSVPLPQSPVQSLYVRNLAPLGAPNPAGSPSISQAAGGSLSARTYFVKYTLTNATGETLATGEVSLAISANNLASVASPPSTVNATGWNVYVSEATGTETKQNSSPLAIGTAWTEPSTGLISGTALPGSNSTANVLSVTWTPQGGTSAKSQDLVPQGVISFCQPNPTGAYIPSGSGGVTALSLQASAANCAAEVIVNG